MIYLSEDHVYTDADGVVIPSVSQIIKDAGLITGTDFIPEYYSDRGHRIHASIRDKYFLGMDIEPEEDETPFLENFNHWFVKSGFEIIYCELKGEASLNGVRFAGTMDLVGTLEGQIFIIDIKNGQATKWHGIQLNGYRHILEQDYDIQAVRLGSLHLKKEKNWLKEHPINNSFKELLL